MGLYKYVEWEYINKGFFFSFEFLFSVLVRMSGMLIQFLSTYMVCFEQNVLFNYVIIIIIESKSCEWSNSGCLSGEGANIPGLHQLYR